MIIKLENLPKISLNKWYSGGHWAKRKKMKDDYKLIIKSQFRNVLPKDKCYNVDYRFYFAKRPLDASNCVAMVKLIEDVIFEDDKFDIVKSIKISSSKGEKDYVLINILLDID